MKTTYKLTLRSTKKEFQTKFKADTEDQTNKGDVIHLPPSDHPISGYFLVTEKILYKDKDGNTENINFIITEYDPF